MKDEIFEYNINHDLDWLKRVCQRAMYSDSTKDRHEQGYNSALKLVIRLINDCMEKTNE